MFLRAQDLLKGVNFDLIVCDEGHRLKNAGTKTTSVSVCIFSLSFACLNFYTFLCFARCVGYIKLTSKKENFANRHSYSGKTIPSL